MPTLLGAAAGLLLLAVLGVIVMAMLPGSREKTSSDVAHLLQNLAFDGTKAAKGDAKAAETLNAAGLQLQKLMDERSTESWVADAKLPIVLRALDEVVKNSRAAGEASQAVVRAEALVPRSVGLLTELIAAAAESGQDAARRVRDGFTARALQIQLDLVALSGGVAQPAAVSQRLGENIDYLNQALTALPGSITRNADAAAKLSRLGREVKDLEDVVRRTVTAAPRLTVAALQAAVLSDNARQLAPIAAASSGSARGIGWSWLPVLPALLALIPLWMIWRQSHQMREEVDRQRLAAAMQRKDADRNQEAILRLLDELSSLADGDLTVQATVTEDMTGAIADSINYAVDALRGLVTTINQSAMSLDAATKQTQALAQHLTKASSAQSRQIGQASESVAEMAGSTEEVSGNAERASDVARHSVDIAHKGGDAVRRTIDGMNAIRETIQETSKRIKRLGESSQEIGNIVELINDIAEQTNILALNASIQASMAGEAGRGFAVVADEVQRLAERAANATKQIEVLVRTIQTDTNEAVVSMERSTADVVGGALLAENAGAALEEIEQVSNQIASLVQNISGSARQQAGSAQAIARNMSVLKEISSQTAESTGATSQQIAKLAELSAELRRSVAGFRLPGGGADRG